MLWIGQITLLPDSKPNHPLMHLCPELPNIRMQGLVLSSSRLSKIHKNVTTKFICPVKTVAVCFQILNSLITWEEMKWDSFELTAKNISPRRLNTEKPLLLTEQQPIYIQFAADKLCQNIRL